MLKTYTLFLRGPGGAEAFEPALCRSDAEVMTRARDLLQRHPHCEAVDVYFGESHLFRIAATDSPAI